MRVLFISPNSSKLYQNLSSISAIETNVWAGLLAQSVRDICEPVIWDMQAEPNKKIEDIDPDFILFVVYGQNPNASSASMDGATYWAEKFSQTFEGKIGFVGPHVNALPYETLEKHPFIDLVFTNEGVYALRNLIEAKFDPEGVKGIWYRDGEIKINPPERIVPQSLLEKDLPKVAYDLMPPLNKYRTSTWHTNFKGETSPFASIYTSLGCFAKCNFCMINIINRTSNENLASNSFNVFRYWSPENTIEQLQYLYDCGVRNLKISDEMFVYIPKHFMRLCELIIERDLKFNIWAYSRVDTVKPHYLETLKKAGVNHLALGIESGSQMVRQEIDKGRFKEINIRDVVSEINNHGIGVGGNFIVGLQTDTYETMQQTKDLAFELDLANMNVYCSTALPGSPLYLEAKQRGRKVPENYSEFGFLSYDHVPDSTDFLTSKEVLAFRDQFFMDYFTSTDVLSRMERKYGPIAVETIKKMTDIPLKRKLLCEP